MYTSFRGAAALLAACFLVSKASAAPQQTTTTAPTTTAPTAAVVQTVISGSSTIVEVPLPTSSGTATGSDASAPTQKVSFPTTLQSSDVFPVCNSTSPRFGPFCNPTNGSEVYASTTYYVTWDPSFFSPNSNITILLNYANDSKTQLWSSKPVENNITFTTVTFEKDWLQGFSFANLTFLAMEYDTTTSSQSKIVGGPTVMLSGAPVVHYAPPPPTKLPNKVGLLVALPVSLGFVVFVVAGLYIGMRHKRTVGLKNIMGRRKGYHVGSKANRRHRMDMGKGGVIRLQERELTVEESLNRYTDESPSEEEVQEPQAGKNSHAREVSLGSLVSTESELDRNKNKEQRYAPTAFRLDGGRMKSWRQ